MVFANMHIGLVLALVVSCSSAGFTGKSTAGGASTPAGPAASTVARTEQDSATTTSTQASSSTTPATAETEVAAEPVSVGGAFLVCDKETDIYCVLNDSNGKKIQFAQQVATTVTVNLFSSAQKKPGTFTWQDPNAAWHWKLDPGGVFTIADVAGLSLHIAGQTDRQADFMVAFNEKPIQVGDGTTQPTQGGCTAGTMNSAVAPVRIFTQDITLVGDQNRLVVGLHRLCGIVRPNEALVQLQKSGATVKQYLLPATTGEEDHSYTFTGLSAGTYTLRLIPGDKIDVDDFAFYGLMLSQ